MNIRNRVAAHYKGRTPADTLPGGWEQIGERNGKPLYRTTPGVAVIKAASNVSDLLTFKLCDLKEGETCPKCLGLPKYGFVDGRREVCYVCDSDGPIDAGDIKNAARRIRQGQGFCFTVTAEHQPSLNQAALKARQHALFTQANKLF